MLVSENITQGLTESFGVLVSRDLRSQNPEDAYRLLMAHWRNSGGFRQ
jgi:hypothetical protein